MYFEAYSIYFVFIYSMYTVYYIQYLRRLSITYSAPLGKGSTGVSTAVLDPTLKYSRR